MPLAEQHRQKLDSIVSQMEANGERPETIQTVVNDFKQKYGGPQDVFQKAVNYHTGNSAVDLPLGLVQGFAKGAASTGVGIGAIARRVAGLPPLPAETFAADTVPLGPGQGTGKFLEQTSEFIAPAGLAANATKGVGLLARAGAQAGVGGLVSGAQSGGDPASIAIGAGLGAAGEVGGAVIKGAKALMGKKAPNLQNFSDAFAAVPTQKVAIQKALPTLLKDGVNPAASVPEMQGVIKSKLQDLGQAYQALPANIPQRTAGASEILQRLQAQASELKRGNVVAEANKALYSKIQSEIETVKELAKAAGGKVSFGDLKYLRDAANSATDWKSPDAEQNIYRGIGNAYRAVMDRIAPETTQLNRDYARYKELESLVDKNISYGRGVTESGLDKLKSKIVQHGVGASAGAALGHAVAGPVGGAAGGIVGGIIGPKLGKTAAQAVQNAIDAGAFQALTPAKQNAVRLAARIGDNAAVLRLLGTSAAQEMSASR